MVHEWSLAEAVIEAVVKEAEKASAREVKGVVIGLGELQNIDLEIFKYALEVLAKDTRVKISEFKFIVDKAVFRCRVCGFTWDLNSISLNEDEKEAIHFIPELLYSFVKCPECGSIDYEIIAGRGVSIKSIEVLR